MATGSFNLWAQLFAKVDTATAHFVTDISGKVIAEASPVVAIGLTLAFLLMGLGITIGTIDTPATEFLKRSFRVAVVSGIALTGGLYQTSIAEAIQRTPDEFASSLISGTPGSSAANIIDKAAEVGFNRAGEAFEKSGFFSEEGLAYTFYAVIVVIATAFITSIGGAFILLSKVALALLAGLGPLFIFMVLWRATHRFFEAWTGQIISYGLLTVLVSAIFGLVMSIFETYMSQVAFDGVMNFAWTLGGCLILTITSGIILLQLPNIAAGLASGVAIGVWYEARVGRSMASSVGRAVAAPFASDSKAGGGRGRASDSSGRIAGPSSTSKSGSKSRKAA